MQLLVYFRRHMDVLRHSLYERAQLRSSHHSATPNRARAEIGREHNSLYLQNSDLLGIHVAITHLLLSKCEKRRLEVIKTESDLLAF